MKVVMQRLCLVVCFIFLTKGLFAQMQKALSIGESIPEIEIGNVINYKKQEINLSEFKGKFLILDFWATWCNPCVKSLPKLDSLQKKYENNIQILAVTDESTNTVINFMQRMEKLKQLSLVTVANDKVLSAMFKHSYLPHCAWIDPKGKVVAITEGEYVNDKNISDALRNDHLSLPIKIDEENVVISNGHSIFFPAIEIKSDNEIMITPMEDSNLLFHSVLSKRISGATAWTSNAEPNQVSVVNTDVFTMFKVALWKHGMEMMNSYKTIADISDTDLKNKIMCPIKNGKPIFGNEYLQWLKNNGFSYELKIPMQVANQKFDVMLSDLNRYFGAMYGVQGTMQKRLQKYLALVRVSKEDLLKSKAIVSVLKQDKISFILHNQAIADFVAYMSLPLQSYPPIVDETGYIGHIDMEINCDLSDLNALNKELMRYGMQLVEKQKQMDIAVIKMKD